MCPRIYNETLTPYRSFFLREIPESERTAYRNDPQRWIDRIAREIAVASGETYSKNIHISPEQVYTHRRDIPPLSRDIFAVASLRSFGVPAYLDLVTMTPHYIHQGKDTEIVFSDGQSGESEPLKATLQLEYDKVGRLDDPGYYTHFTLSQIKDGKPQLLNFNEGATWRNTFADGVDMPAGQTMLVSGQRLADGSVMAHASVFTVAEGSHTHQPLIIRQDTTAIQVIGNFNSENLYLDAATGQRRSLLSSTGRGYYVLALIKPHHEPSSHVLNDLRQHAADFEKWPGKIMLITAGEPSAAGAISSEFPGLPSNAILGTDISGVIAGELQPFGDGYPIVIIADTFNRVVFASEGYTIGIAQKLLDVLKAAEGDQR